MKKLSYIIFIGTILSISCSRWIAPPYTNVELLSGISVGMTHTDVNTILEIEPYDIYFKQGNKDFVALYNYRLKQRELNTNNESSLSHREGGQVLGKEIYKESSLCYIYFKNGKLKSLITDSGKEKSEKLLVKNNNIYLIKKRELGYKKEGNEIYFVPMK